MATRKQEHAYSPIRAALRASLIWSSWTIRYVGTWYVANASWALLDLADRDPSGILAWTDPHKLAGVLLLRHLFSLTKTSPLFAALTLVIALTAGRLLHILSGRLGSQSCEQTIGQLEGDINDRIKQLNKRVDQLEEEVCDHTEIA